jgi:hypothetical protein
VAVRPTPRSETQGSLYVKFSCAQFQLVLARLAYTPPSPPQTPSRTDSYTTPFTMTSTPNPHFHPDPFIFRIHAVTTKFSHLCTLYRCSQRPFHTRLDAEFLSRFVWVCNSVPNIKEHSRRMLGITLVKIWRPHDV